MPVIKKVSLRKYAPVRRTTRRVEASSAPATRSYAPRRTYVRRASATSRTTSKPSGSLGRTILSGGGSLLGGLLGGAFGAPTVGRTIGGMIGDGAATILGMGAYEIKENSLMTSPTVPVMHQVGNSIRVAHREYIGDVVSSATANTFNVNTYPLNPGMSTTFPWLNNIANAFEQYEVQGFAVEFKSGSGDALNSVNTALGNVLMAAKYDASEPAFTSKQSMLNSQWAVEGKPSQNMILPIECAKSENPFSIMYIRDGDLEANEDIKMYDLCNINVATDGCQGTSVNLGSLWVTYDILLKKPITVQSQGLTLKTARFSTTSGTGITGTNILTNMSSTGSYGADNIGLTLTGNSITFPAGTEGVFEVMYFVYGTSAHLVSLPTSTLVNCELLELYNDGGTSTLTNTNPTYPAQVLMFAYAIKITNRSLESKITFSADAELPSSPSWAQLNVTQLNPTIYE